MAYKWQSEETYNKNCFNSIIERTNQGAVCTQNLTILLGQIQLFSWSQNQDFPGLFRGMLIVRACLIENIFQQPAAGDFFEIFPLY